MKKIYSFLFLTCLLFSCVEQKENDDEEVFSDVFISLAESMRLNVAEIYPLPPAPSFDDKNLDTLKRNLLEYAESLNSYSGYLRMYYFNNNTLNPDLLNVKIGINDTLIALNPRFIYNRYSNNDFFKENFEFKNLLSNNINSLEISKPVNLEAIKEQKPFKIVKTSELGWKEELRNNFQDDKDYYLSGVLNLSKVYFNKEKDKGYFLCSEVSKHFEIFTKLILVRKIKGKWEIIEEDLYAY